ncbi:hypothetical protein LLG90_13590 [Aromatoleum toluclasticum]|uniref:hypothetical protein n=1 Tax=Aromatoleum toluclasticum TaxID=92003 RepID=UPI001D180644|nr:hypothetical protein [Aromatoleum toluclasticum]MCC4116388.1 hypothetical protein [Aromatoleum toluclasticum]
MTAFFEFPREADMTRRDAMTIDLFEVPQPLPALEGTHDFRGQVCGLVCEMLDQAKSGGLNRDAVAVEVARLTGTHVSKAMLNNYTSVAHEAFNLPLWEVPALELACGSHLLTQWLVGTRGGKLLVGREALNAELGRLERARDEAARKIKQLKNVMGEQA